ncbi:RibD family protein [Auraticoccus monumenti]|uniref:2,5-diamino-6-(Ribosylamino)-4(3H)-pyrimidinone 5'-phosphate reductase n=1 Tax=Auraticoccus monumenti TaxID=675864 RepID=A0A1G6YT59_9ACTN|nr:RibD family protein [Auraticoccus monumenti]SDD93243.1 2,5-diamino-6-(ribosylamino)-4(3H)-pyrimidinone 5'-phosphate reductase [Auraticoccus monumenti]
MTLPRVTVYNEVTVDGKIEGFSGDGGRYYRRGFGLDYDAIMMGSVTAQSFGPAESEDELTGPGPTVEAVPPPPGFETLVQQRRPTLVVVDGSGTVRNWRHAQAQPWYERYVSLVGDHTPREHVEHLRRRDVEVVSAGSRRVDLPGALEQLRRRHGITSVRTDTGGNLTGALLAAGLVDELVLLVAPKLSSRHRARSLVELPHGLPGSVDLALTDLERLEDDTLWLRYEVRR